MAFVTRIERPRVLLVEDELLVGMDLCDTVEELGFEVDGPYPGWAQALSAIDERMPDFAILDVMIEGGNVYPIADTLSEAGVPIIFHSAHCPPLTIQQRYPQAQACSKPCPPGKLIAMMTQALVQGDLNAD